MTAGFRAGLMDKELAPRGDLQKTERIKDDAYGFASPRWFVPTHPCGCPPFDRIPFAATTAAASNPGRASLDAGFAALHVVTTSTLP
jgi:hypothetical protein